MATQLYSSAIVWVRKSISDAGCSQTSLKPVILACLVFIVFEVTRGNTLSAMRHARIGNRILNERLGLALSSTPTKNPSEESATGTFPSAPTTDLASMNLDAGSRPQQILVESPGEIAFSSPEEARHRLEVLIDAAQETQFALLSLAEDMINAYPTYATIQKRSSRYCLAHTLSKSMPLPPRSQVEASVSEIQSGFLQWKKAFARMLESEAHHSRNLLRLQIRFFCASITFMGCRITSESWTDAFHEDFEKTLQATEMLLLAGQQSGTSSEPVAYSLIQRLDIAEGNRGTNATFLDDDNAGNFPLGPLPSSPASSTPHAAGVFEHGVLPALLMIACKCRDSRIRNKAADLLATCNRMEALVSSEKLARVAKAVIALEEQHAREAVETRLYMGDVVLTEIPESARFSDIVACPVDDSHAMHLSATRYERDGSISLMEYECARLHDAGQEPTFKKVLRWNSEDSTVDM